MVGVNSIIGKNVILGENVTIQHNCIIGDYVRLHSNVFAALLSKIDRFVWIF